MRYNFTARRPRNRCKGLTLVEILAVVVILGLIASTLAISFSGAFGTAKHELAKAGIGQLAQKLELYHLEKGAWPSNDIGLRALSQDHASAASSYFIESEKLYDPWNNPYWFLTPGPDMKPYEVLSYGADGAPGGDGEDADISSSNLRGLE